jgi:SAM-dependent methyltransferase
MAHDAQRQFLGTLVQQMPHVFAGTSVLEIGSLNINGTVRDFFHDSTEYVGVDLCEGPCVDLVASGHEVAFPDNHFDVTISTECFEHNPFWQETFANMIRMTRPGGMVIVTCATTGRAEHGTSRTTPADSPNTVALGWDYYRNLTPEDFKALDVMAAFNGHYLMATNPDSHDLYFSGLKGAA